MNEKYTIPAAIVIAGLLIAGAVMYGDSDKEPESSFRSVTSEDHIRGNPNASITLVEYSDFECPFCDRFHPTMQRVIQENDDVRWVYRHFPLSQIHPNAVSSAVASECVADLAGNDAFWQFADAMFENQGSLGQELYVREAGSLGINESDFLSCLNDDATADRVQADFSEIRGLGATGTPHTLVVVNGEIVNTLPGALPYDSVQGVLDQVKNQI